MNDSLAMRGFNKNVAPQYFISDLPRQKTAMSSAHAISKQKPPALP
ncbi:hypothetical protein [Pseudogulbenkiania ferrooxidans]|nr:hypothetical protein [Pseudogulbenkiania ferrooxidans]